MTSFVAYFTGLARETDVSNATKPMCLLTGLCPEVRSMMPRGITYEALDAMVDVVIRAKIDLQFEVKCTRTWSKKDKAGEKSAAKLEQQQQQQNHLSAGYYARGTDRLRGS